MIVMGIDPDKGRAIAAPRLHIDEVRIEKPTNKHAYHRPGQTSGRSPPGEVFGESVRGAGL